MDLVGVLEGLLFVVGDEGITLEEICDILDISIEKGKEILISLKKEYEHNNRGLKISYLGNSFKLTTKKEHKEFYQKLIKNKKEVLSQSQLEVLAIIAYNEPITRVEIDEIRGISSSYIIKKLVSKDLIKACGASDLPGKPNLYRTTKEFLDCFGLASLNDLPKILNRENNDKEQDLFPKKQINENI